MAAFQLAPGPAVNVVFPPKALRVGEPAELAFEAAAPAELALTLTEALPAGVQADRPSLLGVLQSAGLAR